MIRFVGSLALGAASILVLASGAEAQRQKPAEWAVKPPAAPERPVTETFFGTTLVDPYRYMETPGDPAVTQWMKAQGEHTRSVLDAIPARAAYRDKIDRLGGQFGLATSYAEAGGRAFYLERPAGANVFDLMVRERDGTERKLVDIDALVRATGTPQAINYFAPSPDGSRVAVGISAGGNENADLTIIDAVSGARVAGPIANARFAGPSFVSNDRLAFTVSQALRPDQPKTDTFLNRRAMLWTLGSEPIEIAGAPVGKGPKIRPDESPWIQFIEGSRHALMGVFEGVRNEIDVYVAPREAAAAGRAQWRKLFDRTGGIVDSSARRDTLYALSNKDAPTFKLLSIPLSGSLQDAKTLIPAREGRVLEFVGAASDAVYVAARDGVYAALLRVPHDGGPVTELALPVKGTIGQMNTHPERPGATLLIGGWSAPPAIYRVEAGSGRFAELPLSDRPKIDLSKYVTHDLRAVAKDGVEIPLSVVAAAGPRTPRPLLMTAYGSYGIPQLPNFGAWRLAMIDEGAVSATCHVRGGGELGEAWRLGGKDANKPNTWRDLIACAEYLVREGWTTPDQLGIMGGSAGGIPMGRAMIERPDLFAAVISQVPMASAIRAEFQQNGPVNIVEFGTIKEEAGFRNLLAMDAYYTLEKSRTYPAVLFTTGLNDTRVDSWQPAKAAARMQASGTPNPVLLRIDGAGGHGGGSTRTQAEDLQADFAAFLFWRAGLPQWQPRGGAPRP